MDYQDKYFKYKKKYIDLKKQIEGGLFKKPTIEEEAKEIDKWYDSISKKFEEIKAKYNKNKASLENKKINFPLRIDLCDEINSSHRGLKNTVCKVGKKIFSARKENNQDHLKMYFEKMSKFKLLSSKYVDFYRNITKLIKYDEKNSNGKTYSYGQLTDLNDRNNTIQTIQFSYDSIKKENNLGNEIWCGFKEDYK